ncbi:MAG: hypothetical protein MJZ55_01345 [Paludibacteraceae bacterium]|nr:hypothetical protein [Paludibacteraceae bacterium]
MLRKLHILIVLWLGLFSCQLAYADTCPVDSVITYDQNDNRIECTIYQYDDLGRQILVQNTQFPNGEITSGTKTTITYYETGKIHEKATWTWSMVDADWIGTEKNVYTYNAQGKTLVWEVYMWNNGWSNKSKTEYEYDNKNRQILYITYKGSGAQWIPSTKTENAYDAAGHKILERIWSSYNTSTSSWIGSSWSNWEYNSTTCPSQATMIEQFTWNGKTWSGISKYDYDYDQWGNKTLIRCYTQYNSLTGLWTPSYQYYYKYDTDKRQIFIEEYIYSGGEYVGSRKEEYIFDALGNPLTIIIYAWDASNKEWIGKSNETNIYDDQNRLVEHITYQWMNGTWVGQIRTAYLFPSVNTTQIVNFTWIDNNWVQSTRETQTTQNGKTVLEQKEVWTGITWIGDTKTEYTYSGNILTKKTNYVWDNTIQDWAIGGYVESIYQAGKLIEEISYTYVGGTPIGNSRTTYTYGDVQATTTYAWNATMLDWDTTAYVAKKYQNQLLIEEDNFTYINRVLSGGSKTIYTYITPTNYYSITYTYNGMNWLEDSKQECTQNSTTNTTATYIWQNNGWVGVSQVCTIKDGNYQAKITYQWNDGAWQEYLKQEHFYDNYGHDTLFIDAQYQNGAWLWLGTSTRWELLLDDQQRVLVDAHYTWNATYNFWASTGTKFEYRYDQYGNVIYELRWSKSGSTWKQSSLKEWVYDDSGRALETMSYNAWSQTYWKSGTKTEVAYTDWGQEYINATYQWNKTYWKGLNKTERIYNSKHEEIAYFTYSWRTDHWEYSYKYEKEYDSKGNLLKQTIYTYDNTLNDWVYYSQSQYMYDAKNTQIGEILYTWKNNDWQLQYKLISTYDTDANHSQRTTETGTWTNGQVQSYRLTTYHYACDPKYTITVQPAKEGEGEVTGSGVYTYYARPQIAAIDAPDCYTFNQWTDGDTNATRRIVVTEDATYTAEFTPVTRTITTSVKDNTGGSVKINIER